MYVQIVIVRSRSFRKELPATSIAILVISRFGVDSRIWVLVASVPGYCLLVAFTSRNKEKFSLIFVQVHELAFSALYFAKKSNTTYYLTSYILCYLNTYVIQMYKNIGSKRNEGICFGVRYIGV